ncbi:hypothetical protein BJX66DRAFT_312774 [Aspergillus keveii]|uniref:C6 transcription factor n=1 Tax=Aspergillus keveii TaxID=714993 RepID=A0ABR4FT87_9EURO
MLPSSDEHFEILYPIGGQSDILTMMHLYNATAGSIAGPIKPESVFWRLKNEWIPFALTDPAIYHASLYLASTFQDRLRARIQPRPGMAIESRATLYHQAHAAHYISQKIARCEADDALLAAIQVMILQAIMAKDTITLLQHLRGFVGLLKLYGGVEGMKCLQLIAGAIRVNTIVASMIFDGDPHCTLLPKPAPDEPLPFLTWAVPRIKARPAPEYPLAAVDLFCYAIDALNSFHHHRTDLEPSNPFTSTFTEWLFTTHGLWGEDFMSIPDPSLETAWLAMDCLWYIMSPGPGEENILNDHVAKIKTAIAKVPALTWFQDAPEAFLFAVLVASAAALKRPDLVWLSTFGQFLTSALLGQDNEVYLYFWPCYVGVRAVRRVKMGRVLEDW